MASVLFLSKKGEGLDIAQRFAFEGCLVKCFIEDYNFSLNGNPSRVDRPAMIDQYDLIVCGSLGFGSLCDELKTMKPVIGGGVFNDKLALDGEYQNRVKALLSFDDSNTKDTIPLKLEGWFSPDSTSTLTTVSFEEKRLMDGNIGPLTPSMGCVTFLCEDNELIHRTIDQLIPLLKKVEYQGPLSLNLCVGEQAVSLIDFHTSLSYDSLKGLSELLPKGLFDFMMNLNRRPITRKDYAISVRLTVPPYPYEIGMVNLSDDDAHEVLDFPDVAKKHLFLMPLNHYGIVATCTARSEDLREARRRVYRTVKNIVNDPNVQYRHDIGSKTDEWVGQLKQWGWLNA